MTVRLETMAVKVPGHLTRKREGEDTVLIIDREQASSLYESLQTVVALFDSVKPSQ